MSAPSRRDADPTKDVLSRLDYDAALDAMDTPAERLYTRAMLDRWVRGVECGLLTVGEMDDLAGYVSEIHDHLREPDRRNVNSLADSVIEGRYLDAYPTWELNHWEISQPERAIVRLEKCALRKWREANCGADHDPSGDDGPCAGPRAVFHHDRDDDADADHDGGGND